MLEFDSISVSQYEADTLAPKLTEKSSGGWSVVSIVSAGSTVTAYLSRPAGTGPAAEVDESGRSTAAIAAGATGGADAGAPDEQVASPVESFGGEEVGPLGDADLAGASASPAGSAEAPWSPEWSAGRDVPPLDVSDQMMTDVSVPPAPEPEPIDAPTLPGSAPVEAPSTEPAAAQQPSAEAGNSSLADDVAALASQISDDTPAETSGSAADEGAGWATSGSGAAAYGEMGTQTQATQAEPAQTEAAQTEAAQTEVAQTEAAQTEAAQTEQAQSTGQQQATSAASAPAGWYADPSGRFELRYWDGNQWTEYVSRAGQQYTDPPVA